MKLLTVSTFALGAFAANRDRRDGHGNTDSMMNNNMGDMDMDGFLNMGEMSGMHGNSDNSSDSYVDHSMGGNRTENYGMGDHGMGNYNMSDHGMGKNGTDDYGMDGHGMGGHGMGGNGTDNYGMGGDGMEENGMGGKGDH